MQQTFKSPRCRQPHPYKKVIVVPIDFGNASIYQPTVETTSSRSNSKTKIRLVSPMRKLNQTVFMSKTNQPSYAEETQKSTMSPINTVQIELGGRNLRKNKENTPQTNQKINKNNYNNPYLQSSKHIIQKVHTSTFVQTQQPIPVPIQSQSKMSSLNKSVHISYKPTPLIINHKTPSLCAETTPSITFTHLTKNINFINIPQVKSNFPTELQIRQGDVIEQLKESYECELNDIKRLKQEIEQNNQEIKKLLKSSRASKETTKSKTLLEESVNRQIVNFKEESIKNIASIQNLRLIKCQKEDYSAQLLDYEKKDKAIGSKKTLINALQFQTQEKLENMANYNSSLLQNQALQIQEITLPVVSKYSSFQVKSSQRQFKLTLNNVCQVQCAGSSINLVSQPITLQDSIICQKQELLKVYCKKHTKQQSKIKDLQNPDDVYYLSQLKKQSLKMITSIKSLTKAVYYSDIKQETQKIRQSKISLNKMQFDDKLDNIAPISEKSIKFEKQKSQTTIPIVLQTKKNEVKVPEINFEVKENYVIDQQANKIQYLQIVIKDEVQQPISTPVNNKKGRKINNSIYL